MDRQECEKCGVNGRLLRRKEIERKADQVDGSACQPTAPPHALAGSVTLPVKQ